MNTKVNTLMLLSVLCLLSSCSTSKKSVSMVSVKAPEIIMMEGWFSPETKTKTWSDENGAYALTCPTFSMGAEIPTGQYGELLEEKFEMLCGEITGLDASSESFMQVKMVMTDEREPLNGIDMNNWKVTEVVVDNVWEDSFARVEHKKVWVGPELVETRCSSPLAPADCKEKRHQVQEGSFYRGGRWLVSYDFYPMQDFEPGHIYQVSYTKVYPPKMLWMADGPNYEIKDFKVLQNIKP